MHVNGAGSSSPGRVVQFKALADPTRLAVLARLSAEPTCVCELADGLGVSQPLLSFHLRILREAGLVQVTRRGRWSYYALDEQAVAGLSSVLRDLAASTPASATCVCCGTATAS